MIKIVYITKRGKRIAEEIKEVLDYYFYDNQVVHIKDFKIEGNEEGFIFIMATGIVLRKFLNKIMNDKFKDPFVIVCSENKEIIPLLSNHIGGGNYFSKLIANNINGRVVFTTATDVNGKLGVDELSKLLFLETPKRKDIVEINKKILEEDVNLIIPKHWGIKTLNGYKIEYHDSYEVIINDSIKLKPLKIAVGLGATKNIERHKVYWAIKKAVFLRNIPIWRIDTFATIEDKKDEKGILETINKFKKPLFVFKREEINEVYKKIDLEKSEFVYKHLGVYGVSEPASMLAVKKLTNKDFDSIKLLLKKFKRNGVTVAISIEQ
ncbi:cobalt-precorrin 5A hydrolase [Methanocaldococcus fervens]|uniref:Cobalamin (Vitamin B12) biosynthesis CbiG protein n=1 Tax=Methanocaldococcus fervens (strain DSM 4213 / JCM 15782 / AG86) TaxID=573064 RepID=C7P7U8_METFA|nr:cobalt-precorrin 5A hydrolase [Methanocaldococcus fervens]ACV24630.1 cobalamin (vitamin B12) biosynthesis CbiG protein [Methanocaldococcus fervens AG86]